MDKDMNRSESIRRVMGQAALVVNDEFDRMHKERREMQAQNAGLKEENAHLVDSLRHSAQFETAERKQCDLAIISFFCMAILAFVAVGYAVWVVG